MGAVDFRGIEAILEKLEQDSFKLPRRGVASWVPVVPSDVDFQRSLVLRFNDVAIAGQAHRPSEILEGRIRTRLDDCYHAFRSHFASLRSSVERPTGHCQVQQEVND